MEQFPNAPYQRIRNIWFGFEGLCVSFYRQQLHRVFEKYIYAIVLPFFISHTYTHIHTYEYVEAGKSRFYLIHINRKCYPMVVDVNKQIIGH